MIRIFQLLWLPSLMLSLHLFLFKTVLAADVKLSPLLHEFAQLPDCGLSQVPCLPTPNNDLLEINEGRYAARIRTNEKYGLPGWTRDMGERFHKGVDIVPVEFEKTSKTVKIDYFDPKTKRSFSMNEVVIQPKDDIYAVLDGKVLVANQDFQRSGYGRYVILEHQYSNGKTFVTMYAHMNELSVKTGSTVRRGEIIGAMGNTSSNEGGRRYLQFVPHCHFEVGRIISTSFLNSRMANLLYPKIIGGNADPRNIQPFDPIEFLTRYSAEKHNPLKFSRSNELSLREDESRSTSLKSVISKVSH